MINDYKKGSMFSNLSGILCIEILELKKVNLYFQTLNGLTIPQRPTPGIYVGYLSRWIPDRMQSRSNIHYHFVRVCVTEFVSFAIPYPFADNFTLCKC